MPRHKSPFDERARSDVSETWDTNPVERIEVALRARFGEEVVAAYRVLRSRMATHNSVPLDGFAGPSSETRAAMEEGRQNVMKAACDYFNRRCETLGVSPDAVLNEAYLVCA